MINEKRKGRVLLNLLEKFTDNVEESEKIYKYFFNYAATLQLPLNFRVEDDVYRHIQKCLECHTFLFNAQLRFYSTKFTYTFSNRLVDFVETDSDPKSFRTKRQKIMETMKDGDYCGEIDGQLDQALVLSQTPNEPEREDQSTEGPEDILQ